METGVAFVGGGMVSDLHRSAVSATPGLRLVGVHDADATVRERRSTEWRIKGHQTLQDVLRDDSVQAVYVLTPPESHVPIALQCLAHGRHVLLEKPVSYDAEEVEALLAASQRSQRVTMAAHNYAYIPEFQRIHRLVRGGDLGTIRSVWITYAIKHPEHVAAAYGGVLEEVMIHHAYLTLALLGPPEGLYAGIHEPAWERHPAEDQAWMVWEYQSGTSAFLFATFAADDNSTDPWTFVVKVIGTEGSATMSWRSAMYSNRVTSWFAFGFPLYEESYQHESQAFRDAIASGVAPISGLAEAATSARLIQAAYRAAERHERVGRRDHGDGGAPRW